MYKQLIFSKTAAKAAFICVFLFSAAYVVIGLRLPGESRLDAFDLFDIFLRFALSAFLFHSYIRHKLLAMQAGICGLLTAMIYYQGHYVTDNLFSMGSETFITLGFWGSLYLAGELMVLILEIILTVNHFVIFVLRKNSILRVAADQITSVILYAFLLFQIFTATRIVMNRSVTVFTALYNILLIAMYFLISCSELVLVIDAGEAGDSK